MRNYARIRAHLAAAPEDTPVALSKWGGETGDWGMRLRLRLESSALHSAWLSAAAWPRGVTSINLLDQTDARPFAQFAAAASGSELMLIANGGNAPERLLGFVERERTFPAADFDDDGVFKGWRKA